MRAGPAPRTAWDLRESSSCRTVPPVGFRAAGRRLAGARTRGRRQIITFRTPAILGFATLALAGCIDKDDDDESDSGWDTESDADTDADGDSDADTDADSVESCTWTDIEMCFEFTNYSDTKAWCDDMGSVYSISTDYAAAGCASGEIGTCALGAGGDMPVASTVYYYSPTWNGSSAEEACEGAGGNWN